MSKRLALSFCLTLLGCPLVEASDLNPAPFRGDPHSVFAEWAGPNIATGNIMSSSFVATGGTYPLFNNEDFGPIILPGAVPLVVAIPEDQAVLFYLPNFVDPLPEKRLRWQFTYTGEAPTLEHYEQSPWDDEFEDFDPVYDTTTGGESYFYQDAVAYPNPDWEVLGFFVPEGMVIHHAVFDTVSVPEPSCLVTLVGLGIVGSASVDVGEPNWHRDEADVLTPGDHSSGAPRAR